MKYADINAIFTAKVAEYLSKGYVFNTPSMAGHQGEIAKVDLRNGEEIIRINMDSTYGNWRYGVAITVGRYTEEQLLRPMEFRSTDTIWTNRMEVIERREFWQMLKNGREADFFIEGEAGENAVKLHEARCEARYWNQHPQRIFENVEKTMVKAVKRHLNRSSFKAANIKKVWKQWDSATERYTYRIQTLKHTIVLG